MVVILINIYTSISQVAVVIVEGSEIPGGRLCEAKLPEL